MFGIKVQEKNETSILCAILLIYKSCFFRQQIYIGEKRKKLFLILPFTSSTSSSPTNALLDAL